MPVQFPTHFSEPASLRLLHPFSRYKRLPESMLTCQKEHFSLPEDVHYLNCAYMSPLLKGAEEAGRRGLARKRLPTDIRPEDFFAESKQVRRLFARCVGAINSSRIAIMPAVSYGMATVLKNTEVQAGQNVVVTAEQFPSNVYPWRKLQREQGAELRTINPPSDDRQRGRCWNERILAAIDGNTAVVALPHVHWTDGTLFDLGRIGERARDVGAAVIVDGTQSVGALPFDVQRLQPDALICAGYKWLFGPYGLAMAYLGPRYDDGQPLEETWIGRRGSEDFGSLVEYESAYREGADRFDVGERSNPILLPVMIAALEQLLDWGIGEVQDYCRRLTTKLINDARSWGYTVEEAAWRGSHLFGLRLPETASLDRLRKELNMHRVQVSVRSNAVRIGPNVYNNESDIDALRNCLKASVTGVASA